MKTTKLAAAILFITALAFAVNGCGNKDTDKKTTDVKQEEQKNQNTNMTTVSEGKYFCSMHPVQQSNDADAKCSICKMKLTSMDEHNKEMMKMHEDMEGKHAGMKDMIHFEIQLAKIKSDECERMIKKALKNTDGVMDFYIDIIESKAHMYIDKSKTTKKDIEKAISDLGFDANDIKANPDAAAKLPYDCK